MLDPALKGRYYNSREYNPENRNVDESTLQGLNNEPQKLINIKIFLVAPQ